MTQNSDNGFWAAFPSKSELLKWYGENGTGKIFSVNAHLHTPYSFSAFSSIGQAIKMAVEEQVKVLGINDFNTAEGYDEFYDACTKAGIYPLFNIEFTGVIEEYRATNIRVNDTNNPSLAK